MSCILVGGRTCNVSKEAACNFFMTEEDLSSIFLLNLDTHLPDYVTKFPIDTSKSALPSPEVRRTEHVIRTSVAGDNKDLQFLLPLSRHFRCFRSGSYQMSRLELYCSVSVSLATSSHRLTALNR